MDRLCDRLVDVMQERGAKNILYFLNQRTRLRPQVAGFANSTERRWFEVTT